MPKRRGPWCFCQAHRLHSSLFPARWLVPLPDGLARTFCSGRYQTFLFGPKIGSNGLMRVDRTFISHYSVWCMWRCCESCGVFCCAYLQGCDNLSLSDHLLRAVLNLLRREVSEHGRHLQQYFNLFVMYANLGKEPVSGHSAAMTTCSAVNRTSDSIPVFVITFGTYKHVNLAKQLQ